LLKEEGRLKMPVGHKGESKVEPGLGFIKEEIFSLMGYSYGLEAWSNADDTVDSLRE